MEARTLADGRFEESKQSGQLILLTCAALTDDTFWILYPQLFGF
jgi:hypothetical protein